MIIPICVVGIVRSSILCGWINSSGIHQYSHSELCHVRRFDRAKLLLFWLLPIFVKVDFHIPRKIDGYILQVTTSKNRLLTINPKQFFYCKYRQISVNPAHNGAQLKEKHIVKAIQWFSLLNLYEPQLYVVFSVIRKTFGPKINSNLNNLLQFRVVERTI